MDKTNTKFKNACNLIINTDRERNQIGTLGEKTLHAVLKHYIEPDTNKHEIKIGNYFADIYNEDGIFEIQTRSFNVLRDKLSYFLTDHKVTVVYPVPHNKWIVWIDQDTGETTKKRKSPKVGQAYDVFYELYKIKQLLAHPNLEFCIVLLDIIEYRKLNGWSNDKKKGSSRYDRIPKSIFEEIHICSVKDYERLIPSSLPDIFTTKDFKESSGLSLRNSQLALNVLKYIGAVLQVGKQGRAYTYKLNQTKKTP